MTNLESGFRLGLIQVLLPSQGEMNARKIHVSCLIIYSTTVTDTHTQWY